MKVDEEKYFIDSDKEGSDKIFLRRLFRGEKPRKKVFYFIHEVGTHSGVFDSFFKEILKYDKSIEIFCIDIFGHGRSGGERLGSCTIQNYQCDIKNTLEKVSELSGLPIFMSGIGFGAGLVLNFLSEVEDDMIRGVVLFNPMLEVDLGYNKIEKLIFSDFSQGSSLRVPSKISPSMMVDSENGRIDLSKDPLCFNFYTRGLLRQMRMISKSARQKAYFVDQPSFIILSNGAKLYNNEIVPIFSKGLRSKKIKVENIEGSHLFPVEEKKFIKNFVDWLSEND